MESALHRQQSAMCCQQVLSDRRGQIGRSGRGGPQDQPPQAERLIDRLLSYLIFQPRCESFQAQRWRLESQKGLTNRPAGFRLYDLRQTSAASKFRQDDPEEQALWP